MVMNFLNRISSDVGLKDFPDWYGIGSTNFRDYGGYLLMVHHGGAENFLRTFFPQYAWNSAYFELLKGQYLLEKTVRRLFQEMLYE